MKQTQAEIFTANLIALQKFHPQTYRLIIDGDWPEIGEIFYAANGKANLKIVKNNGREIIFHDYNNPGKEADYFLDSVVENKPVVVIFSGMGLGYGPMILLQERKDIQFLIVFEPKPELFIQAMHAHDLSGLLGDPRLILHVASRISVDESIMYPAQKSLQTEETHIFRHLPSFEYDLSAYSEIHDMAFEFSNKLNIIGHTIIKQGARFMANRFNNIKSVHHDYQLDSLCGCHKNEPVILVSAGPSLDKNINLLSGLKGTAVIMAIDSALPALVAHNIMPNYLVSMDADDVIFEKISDQANQASHLKMIYQNSITTRISHYFPASVIYWTFGDSNIDKWFKRNLQVKFSSEESQSNAHLALQAAILMEASPIIFIGQDLAYIPGKTHSVDAVLGENDAKRNDADMLSLDGVDGKLVYTTRGFLKAKKYFEEIIAAHPGHHYINATEGGAGLEGTEVMSLAKAINGYCHNPLKPNTLADMITTRTDTSILLKNMKKITGLIKRVRNDIKKSEGLVNNLHRTRNSLKNKINNIALSGQHPPEIAGCLHKIDQLNQKIDSRKELWEKVDEITIKGLRDLSRLKTRLSLLAREPEKYDEWLATVIIRFTMLNRLRKEALQTLSRHIKSVLLFHKTEKKLLHRLSKSGDNRLKLLEVIRFYMEQDKFRLAEPYLLQLVEANQQDAESDFYLGCIAARRSNFTQMDTFFFQAASSPVFAKKVKQFRRQLGDEYLDYSRSFFQKVDNRTACHLAIKGLYYCPDHEELRSLFTKIIEDDVRKLTCQLEEKNLATHSVQLEKLEKLTNDDRLVDVFEQKQMADIYYLAGRLAEEKEKYGQAANYFQKAATVIPDKPEYYISLTSVFFNEGNYQQAIVNLKKAVALDCSQASHWEEIGDFLAQAGQYEDANSAYEQCFLALPDNIEILKKMAQCYLALSQEEAARETLLRYKELRRIN